MSTSHFVQQLETIRRIGLVPHGPRLLAQFTTSKGGSHDVAQEHCSEAKSGGVPSISSPAATSLNQCQHSCCSASGKCCGCCCKRAADELPFAAPLPFARRQIAGFSRGDRVEWLDARASGLVRRGTVIAILPRLDDLVIRDERGWMVQRAAGRCRNLTRRQHGEGR